MLIPIPKSGENEYPVLDEVSEARIGFIKWFLDCPSWKCPSCNLTNFGRNKFCADRKCRLPRPLSYIENVYEEER